MISRIWHGYTSQANANSYETLLKEEIFVGISNHRIRGYRGIRHLRRNIGTEVEFIRILWFDSFESVRKFAGEDYEQAVVPPKAQTLLSRFDSRSQHYEAGFEMY